jgi:hypothetical protein
VKPLLLRSIFKAEDKPKAPESFICDNCIKICRKQWSLLSYMIHLLLKILHIQKFDTARQVCVVSSVFINQSELFFCGFRDDSHYYYQLFHPRRAKVTAPFSSMGGAH